MRLSTKCTYAIRALFDIAYNSETKPVSGKEIAKRQEVPHRFLEQILLDLKRAQLVFSKRGPQGGYTLAKKAASISLLDVVETVDGPVKVDLAEGNDHATCYRSVTDAVLCDVVDVIRAELSEITLETMMQRAEQMGVAKVGQDVIFYVI